MFLNSTLFHIYYYFCLQILLIHVNNANKKATEMNDSQFFPPQEPANFLPNPQWPSVKSEEEDPAFPAIDFDEFSLNDVIMTSPLCPSDPQPFDPFGADGFYSGGLDFPLDHDLGESFQCGGFLDEDKFDPGRSSLRELIESKVRSEKKPFNFGKVEDRKVDKSMFSADQKSNSCFKLLF